MTPVHEGMKRTIAAMDEISSVLMRLHFRGVRVAVRSTTTSRKATPVN
ncbi:hypothetical protein RSSM_04413 [Rhodopirellula sallentina SM41]|uniref:Uncharacterized protein n=1 Tax=Rhodopirellula sallentina SM41 TaxID=1263870 RepID=M5UDS4_9BACT|nr:hypothetical protein RSSM_04413 [Rhodopirellula sallentina SM41]